MSSLYGDEEKVCIRTLDDSLLGSFRLGEKVTITIKGDSASKTLSCTVEELEATEEVEDYSASSKGGKPTMKTRPGEIELVIGDDVPEVVGKGDMLARMEEDDDY